MLRTPPKKNQVQIEIAKNAESPSCIYQVNFCKICNSATDKSNEIKCDNCRNYFHTNCIEMKNGTTTRKMTNELIVLCQKCKNENKICTQKDMIEIKSTNKNKNNIKQMETKI